MDVLSADLLYRKIYLRQLFWFYSSSFAKDNCGGRRDVLERMIGVVQDAKY